MNMHAKSLSVHVCVYVCKYVCAVCEYVQCVSMCMHSADEYKGSLYECICACDSFLG